MRLKKWMTILIAGIGITATASAADLMQAYQDALQNDQQYKEAQAQYLSDKEILAQARSLVLPDVVASGNAGVNWNNQHSSGAYTAQAEQRFQGYGYNLQLTQAVFDWSAFAGLRSAKASVRQAAASFASAQEDLVARVANAYFNVLEAEEVMRANEARQEATLGQLNVARQRYRVGLDAITTVYQAQAGYDTAHASYISSQNQVSVQQENLRVITGKLYPELAPLKYDFPLVKPTPANIDTWTKVAVEQNLSLKSARFNSIAAQEQISVNSGQRMPSLNLVGSFGQNQNTLKQGGPGTEVDTSGQVGLDLNFNPYKGGLITSQVRQAQANYELAVAQMDQSYRQTVANTRQNYLTVISDISLLEADRQSIKSAQSALESTEAGYKVGTQTIIDVLNEQQVLFENQTTYAQDRFSYLNTTLSLKQNTGMLKPQDLQEINQWLVMGKNASKKMYQSLIKRSKSPAAKKAMAKRATTITKPTAKKTAVAKKAAVKKAPVKAKTAVTKKAKPAAAKAATKTKPAAVKKTVAKKATHKATAPAKQTVTAKPPVATAPAVTAVAPTITSAKS